MLNRLFLAAAAVALLAGAGPTLADQVYVHVSNGVVDNRAVFAALIPANWPDRARWFASDEAQIGWSYANGAFAAPPAAPETAPTARQQRAATFRSDPARADMLTRLQTATPAQIDAYIEANVTNLAQARAFLKALTKVVALDVRQ